MLAIVSKFLSFFVDAGFVPVLPLHHRDLELDSVGVILVAWRRLGGANLRDKNACARTSTENVGGGGLIHEGGRICRTLQYM